MSSEPECLQCRLIGGGAFAGAGAYAIWSSRPKAVGSPLGKRLVGLMGGALLIAGVYRLWPLQYYYDQRRSIKPQLNHKS